MAIESKRKFLYSSSGNWPANLSSIQ